MKENMDNNNDISLPCLFDNRRVKLYIWSAVSHSIKSHPEIEKAE